MGQTQGGAAGVENQKSIFLVSGEFCLLEGISERPLLAEAV